MLARLQREVCQIPVGQSQYPWDLASGTKDLVSRCVLFAREYADPVQSPLRTVLANLFLSG